MTQELIERLRARRKRELTLSLAGVVWEPLVNPDGPEAANALQSQSARIAELEGEKAKLTALARSRLKVVNAVKDENERLRLSLTKDSTSG